MQEYCEYVQKGFRILLPSLAGFIGMEMNKVYKDDWWSDALAALNYPRELPWNGTYSELVDSLDIANCIRLIDRKWKEVFEGKLNLSCRYWAKELMGVRNIVSHLGQ